MSTKAGTKTSELKSEVIAFKRRRILEVSAHLIFEHGYERTTLDAVAENLQVTKPYIYSYFKNKGDILYEICQTGIDQSAAMLNDALALKGTPTQLLKIALERVALIVMENREHVVVYQREAKNLPKERSRHILEKRKKFDIRMAQLLEKGVKSGEFSVPDVGVTATTIGGILSWLPSWYLPNGRLTPLEIAAITVQLIQKMVVPEKKV